MSEAPTTALAPNVPFFVKADQGFGSEHGLALHFEETTRRVLVLFVDGGRSWCEQWEVIGTRPHPVTLAELAEAFIEMIPGGEVDAEKRDALAAIRSIKGWFD